MQLARLQARFDGAVSVVTAIGTALVVVVGVFRVPSGALSPGDLVVFATYARKLNSPLKDIARESGKTSKALARADEIAELLAADEILEERPGAYRGPRARGAIEVEGVTFSHTADRSALTASRCGSSPGRGSRWSGPPAPGKSTLAALIARFYDPASGRVLIDGRDLRDCRLAWLRDQIGVLLQDTVLFTGTVAENIAYGTSATEGEIVAAAKAAAAHAFVSELPDGYDDPARPAGRRAVGRPAAADRDRPDAAAQPAGAGPRRADDRPRRREPDARARRAARADARAHDDPDHPPDRALGDRRPGARDRARPDRPPTWSPRRRRQATGRGASPPERAERAGAVGADDRAQPEHRAVERPRSARPAGSPSSRAASRGARRPSCSTSCWRSTRAGALAARLRHQARRRDAPQPGAERLAGRVEVLAPGTAAEQARASLGRARRAPASPASTATSPTPRRRSRAVAARALGVPYGFSVHARDARKVAAAELRRARERRRAA